MKEILSVELDRNEIEEAISQYLSERGYEMKNIDFHTDFYYKVASATVVVSKSEVAAK